MLEKLLSEKQEPVLKRWFQYILDTYPADTASFLRKEKNRFNNPVGSTIAAETETIYNALLTGTSAETLYAPMEKIIKIRAVQDFSPGRALGFIFLLKNAIRKELSEELQSGDLARELLQFESRIDHAVGLALDIYMKTREKMFEIKVNEVKARTFKLLERAKLITTIPDDDGDSINTNV